MKEMYRMMLMANKRAKSMGYVLAALALILLFLLMLDSILKIVYPIKYGEYVFRYSRESNIDPYLVFAIIKVESGFNPQATSSKNARGLMQITDKTGKWGAESLNLDNFAVGELYDPKTNIQIGCWYLNMLMKEFNNDLNLAVAAYNAGSGNVSKWLKDTNYSSSGQLNLDRIPFKETRDYIKKVKKCHLIYKRLYEKHH